jgi:acetyltransferase-like isoleucine patch superfamily enzyme
MLDRIITKILGVLFNKFDKYLAKEKERYVTLSSSTVIHKEAVIRNFQLDKSKIVIGRNSHIRGNIQLFKQGGEIIIGDHCYVGEGTYIWSAKRIQIGNRVLIAHNVNIHDNNSHPTESNLRYLDYLRILGLQNIDENQFNLCSKQVVIKDDAWIGFNSIILKGVTVGNGAIIGAGSVVTKDVPDFAVVAGNPARIIKMTT